MNVIAIARKSVKLFKGHYTRVPGKIGYCLQFDGKEGFVEHPHTRSLILDRLAAFTLEAWIRTSQLINQSILAKQNLEYRGYHLLVDNRPDPANPFVLRLVMPAVPASNEIKVIGTQPLTDGRWHYVVASYDGSGKAAGVKLYVDGKLEKSEIVYDSLRDSLDVDFPCYIANRGRGDMKFRGQLDEIRISAVERSAGWIKAQYETVASDPIIWGPKENRR